MSELGFELAMKRPANYHNLIPSRQWEEDKFLGILDWDGDMTEEQRAQYKERFSV